MKLTVGEIFEANMALVMIMNDGLNRKLPILANYRIARLHLALQGEVQLVVVQRDALIKELGKEILDEKTGAVLRWEVPEGEKQEEWKTKWKELSSHEIDVTCEVMPLSLFGENGAITAQEFRWMGSLVKE